jgi:hypothetical protein
VKRCVALSLVALLLSCCDVAPGGQPARNDHRRGVRIPGLTTPQTRTSFVREESAALFVGVREFIDAPLAGVSYTVDDAVDLAYVFAFERKVGLVEPHRVVLALSGIPRKTESQDRLQKLVAAGAVVKTATLEHILGALEQQTRAAGNNGLLILSFASHGFTRDGVPYVLSATSHQDDPASSISAAKVLDIASTSRAQRSLIFIDACRERVGGARGASGSPPPPAAVVDAMSRAVGQAVFYAAAPGYYAYEDERARNGVFTKAVIEGLLVCNARTVQGLVTVGTLAEFVEERVRSWVHKYRDPAALRATQVSMDTGVRLMPLSSCTRPPSPLEARAAGSTIVARGVDGAELWRRETDEAVGLAAVADLDVDSTNEVVAAAGNTISAYDALGVRLWSVDLAMPVRSWKAEHLFTKRKRQIVAVTESGRGSAVSLIDADGTLLAAFSYPRKLQHVLVDQLTSRHERKVIVSSSDGQVFLLDPRKERRRLPPYLGVLGAGAEEWRGSVLSSTVTRLSVIDYDNDGKRDIALATPAGRIYLDFEGKIIATTGSARFHLHAPKAEN